jgi:FHS family L-fucose permease-like MFS transporter
VSCNPNFINRQTNNNKINIEDYIDMTMTEEQPKSNALPMAIVAVLFFILGFATWLNGSLMPYLKQILQLTLFQASLILFSFYIAVTFTALPSASIIRKVGYKNGMALGMASMMVAGLLFILAAQTQIFALFLFAQLVMGSGITLLQTAVNPYVVRLGPEESAAARISVMGISGGAFGPLFWGLVSGSSLGQQGAYMVMLPCYLFILFYALKGHKMKSWK